MIKRIVFLSLLFIGSSVFGYDFTSCSVKTTINTHQAARTRFYTFIPFGGTAGMMLFAQTNTEELAMDGEALPYPNPFKSREGTELGYQLNKNADIEIRIYNSTGQEVGRKTCESGLIGGQVGYNHTPINSFDFYGADIPAGIYFFIILSGDKVLGKGKLAVIP